MSSYTTLVGYEQIERAGYNMVHAAESIERSAALIHDSNYSLVQQLERLIQELHALKENN